MRMLDLFCGRFGWSKAFADRGWDCIGLDLVEPPEVPDGCEFLKEDILRLHFGHGEWYWSASGEHEPFGNFDFICASSPCEQFSVHGMKHFHPNPPYPELGIKLFNHTRSLCEASGVPYVMENVRAAQAFVGTATHHCGPFYLWGSGVPSLMPQAIKKGLSMRRDPITGKREPHLGRRSSHNSKMRAADKAITATIPPELSNVVCDYAEALIAQREVMAWK